MQFIKPTEGFFYHLHKWHHLLHNSFADFWHFSKFLGQRFIVWHFTCRLKHLHLAAHFAPSSH